MIATLAFASAFWVLGLALVHQWRQEMHGMDRALYAAFNQRCRHERG